MLYFHIPGAVRLTPNVAYRKQATQSLNTHLATNAIDGQAGTCARIPASSLPIWWQVDLLEVYEITKVRITTSTAARYTGMWAYFFLTLSLFYIFFFFFISNQQII